MSTKFMFSPAEHFRLHFVQSLLTQQQLRTARSFQLCSGVLGLSAT